MISHRAVDELRGALTESAYAEARLSGRGDEEVRLRRARGTHPLQTLLALFQAGHTVPETEVSRLFGRRALDDLVARGLLRAEADSVASPYRITASDGLLIIHDPSPPIHSDHITGLNPAARTLATLTPRKPVETALDIGTGCGYQALLMARHVQKIVATDILPRALSLTALNAELNGISNIECRPGSFFEPVEGERFDLIVCNPPFIISPDNDFSFRDAGLGGDAVSQLVLETLPSHLSEDGFATVLVNWGLKKGEAWDDPGKRWLENRPCDALFVRYGAADPLSYAATWNAQLPQLNPGEYGPALDRWVAYLARLEFESVTEIGVMMRRRRGSNWMLSLEGSIVPAGDATGQLTRMFAAQAFLRTNSANLQNQRFRLVEGHRLEQTMDFVNGAYEIRSAAMSLPAGVGVGGEIPADLIPLLFTLSAGTLLEVATSFADDAEIELATVMPRAEALVLQLLERGLLERLHAE